MAFEESGQESEYTPQASEQVPVETRKLRRRKREPGEPKPPRRKVSWVAAAVVCLVAVLLVIILALAFLMPNYRKGARISKVVNGSEKIELTIYTNTEAVKKHDINPIKAEDLLIRDFEDMGAAKDNVVVRIILTDRQESQEAKGTSGG